MKLPHLGFYDRRLFGFARGAGMAVVLAGRAVVPALPYYVLSIVISLLPSWQVSPVFGLQSEEVRSVLQFFSFAARLYCFCAIFCLTLQQALEAFLPESQEHTVSEESNVWPLVKAMLADFFKTLVGVSVISYLLAYLLTGPFSGFFEVMASSQNLAKAAGSFVWHFALELINPWMWLVGFIASRFFMAAAGHSVDVFSNFMRASRVELRHQGQLLLMIKTDRRYFTTLVAVPHLLFGILISAVAAFAPKFNYGALLGFDSHIAAGPMDVLPNMILVNVLLGFSAALVAGFIAIIWFAAARRVADIVSDQVEDRFGRRLFG